MSQYKTLNVQLSNSKLNNLKSENLEIFAKNKAW